MRPSVELSLNTFDAPYFNRLLSELIRQCIKKLAFVLPTIVAISFAPIAIAQQDGKPTQSSPAQQNPPAASYRTQKSGNARGSGLNSIYVGQAKVYDDQDLERLLAAAQRQLSTLQFLNQPVVAAKEGAVQGGSSQQSQLSFQGQGPPLPQVISKETQNGPAATTPTLETDTTRAALNPSIPTLPTGGTSGLPTPSISAIDTLDEQIQLTYEVTNLQLLLEGSLSDRLINPLTCPESSREECTKKGYMSSLPSYVKFKQRATIGFPISIQTPQGSEYENALAEVVVTVTTGTGCAGKEPPGVITILPRERTYNEATISDKSTGFGLAAVTQVFSVGVAGARRSQTYFVVQDLDTVAFQTEPIDSDTTSPGCETSFGWQFRPTLGRKKVRAGLRQTFVQLSFAVNSADLNPTHELGYVEVETHWRHYDQKTGAVGSIIPERTKDRSIVSAPKYKEFLPAYSLVPSYPALRWSDAGSGQIYIEAAGSYQDGTSISVGANVWNTGMPGFSVDANAIHFVAPVAQFMANEDAYIVSPGGERVDFVRTIENVDLSDAAILPLEIVDARATSWSATESAVTVCYSGGYAAADPMTNVLALVGGTVWGLSDRPFTQINRTFTSTCPEHPSLMFHAPTATIRQSPEVRLKQLLLGSKFSDVHAIEFANDFTATNVTAIAKNNECTLFEIQGSQLSSSIVVRLGGFQVPPRKPAVQSCDFTDFVSAVSESVPSNGHSQSTKTNAKAATPGASPPKPCPIQKAYVDSTMAPTILVLAIPNCLLANIQEIEMYRADDASASPYFVMLPLTTPKTAQAASLDKLDVPKGTKTAKLTGKQLQLVDLTSFHFTQYADKLITATIAADESSIEITIPDVVTGTAGYYVLSFTQNDQSKTKGVTLVEITEVKASN